MREVSSFPPHLVDARGRVLPSSMIPFCAYQTSMLGLARTDLPFTSCSQAQPTLLEGQLCYSINVSDIAENKTMMGKQNGLLMLLDVGPETSSTGSNENKQNWTRETTIVDLEMSDEQKTSPKIFIHTLSEFSHYGEGESSYYAMSALKNMVGSKSFMEFPDAVKKCQVEKMEKCLSDHFFEKVQEQCECLPWRLATFNTTKFNISDTVVRF